MNSPALPRLPHLDALDARGWELRLQSTWISPPRAAFIPGINTDTAPSPRTNLVVSIAPVAQGASLSADEQAHRFLDETLGTVNVDLLQGPTAFAFADGTTGARLEIRFPATADVWLKQHHFFRVDAGHCTQAVVTSELAPASDEDLRLAIETARHLGSPFAPPPAPGAALLA